MISNEKKDNLDILKIVRCGLYNSLFITGLATYWWSEAHKLELGRHRRWMQGNCANKAFISKCPLYLSNNKIQIRSEVMPR